MPRSARFTIFKWGYGGWGNATRTLIRSVDAAERKRGYNPPIFVDIRYSRSVRAVGFRERAFERLLGHARYRWMRSLGNAAIGTRGKMRIQCPDAAEQLLDLAIDAAAVNRRVIFFCSCPSPHGAEYCHRTKVATRLSRAARQRGVRIEIEEWPGGVPSKAAVQRMRIDENQLRKIRNGATTVPLTNRQASAFGALPWGALIELAAGADKQLVSAGPAQYFGKRWGLPVFLFPVEEGDDSAFLMRFVQRLRSKSNLEAIRT